MNLAAPIARTGLIGIGLYTVPDAARLTRVAPGRIRRWLRGSARQTGDAGRAMPPIWSSDLPVIDGAVGLSFLDLMEVRFVDAFLEAGVTWPLLRRAAEGARRLMRAQHPFATQRFATDGRRLFAEIGEAEGEPKLLDLASGQFGWDRAIRPSLTAAIDFSDAGAAARWWPMGRSRPVVLDPQRSFGQPIAAGSGVPTAALAAAVRAEGEDSVKRVAAWFAVAPREVAAALEFEEKLAA